MDKETKSFLKWLLFFRMFCSIMLVIFSILLLSEASVLNWLFCGLTIFLIGCFWLKIERKAKGALES